MVPADMLKRLSSKSDKNSVRSEGIKIALETIEKLSAVQGLRGLKSCVTTTMPHWKYSTL